MKTHLYHTRLILLILCIIFVVNELSATGVLYVRPRFSGNNYEKVWIKSIDVQTTFQDQVAVTHVDQVFFNELTTSAEAIYIFPLPENAMITELVYWVNGERFVAEIRERQAAINAYNKKLRQWMDPALLEYLGDNLFRLSIVPVDAQSEFRTEVTYVELLNYDFGVSRYKYLMNTLDLSSKPLNKVHFSIDAQSQNTYKYFSSPSHSGSAATQITKLNDYHYTFEFGDENFYPDTDIEIEFETVREKVEFSLLTYTPAQEDSFGTDSFYALWVTPPDTVVDDDLIPKDIVFTVDVSSSMEGERMAQAKQSLDTFLDNLNEQDRFNIITFGTHVVKYKADLVEATPTNISDAHDFVYKLYALGMTNISAALDSSLLQSYMDKASKNLIFLTDGSPTIGETNPDTIIGNVNTANTIDLRIFSFGVGESINRAFLKELALDNNGYATFITSDDSIALLISNHFTRISKPVMTNLNLDFGGLQVMDRYPKVIMDLFWGSQALETGLYTGSGSYPVELSGWMGADSVNFTKIYSFTDTIGGYRFVPRLWAQAKINHLLDLIEIYGETDELVNQIIELSLRFQILTPYTAFYVDPEDPGDETGIDEDSKIKPNKFQLFANYPNPFNPQTTIKYTLPAGEAFYDVTVKIYDALGRLIMVLVREPQRSGLHTIVWDGRNATGQSVPSGVYFCVLQAGQYNATQKMLLIR